MNSEIKNLISTFEYSLDAMIIINASGEVIYLCDQAQSVFGFKLEEVKGKLLSEYIIPKEYRSAHAKSMKHFLETGEASILNTRVELPALHKSGKQIDIELSVIPYVLKETNEYIFIGFTRDISHIKKQNLTKKLQQDLLKALVNDNPFNQLPNILEMLTKALGYDCSGFWTLNESTGKLELSSKYVAHNSHKFKSFYEETNDIQFSYGDGAPGRAWKAKAAFYIEDIKKDDNFPRIEIAERYQIRGGTWVPIFSNQRFHGVLEFLSEEVILPGDTLQEVLKEMIYYLSDSMDKQVNYQDILREKRQFSFFSQLTIRQTQFNKIKDLNKLIEKISQLITPEVADWAFIRILMKDGIPKEDFTVYSSPPGTNFEQIEYLRKKYENDEYVSDAYQSYLNDETIFYENLSDKILLDKIKDPEDYELTKSLQLKSFLVSPIKMDNKIIGTITLMTTIHNDNHFSKEDAQFSEELGRRIGTIVQSFYFIQSMDNAKQAAMKANSAKGMFLANMSHEIRTPLGAILGFASILNEQPLSKELKTIAQKIMNNGNHLLSLINDILDLSKIENEQVTIKQAPFNLLEVLHDLQSTFENQLSIKNIKFNYIFLTMIPEFISSDLLKFKQILMNLLGNSVKFTNKGSITVSLSLKEDKFLYFLIEDTGVGIDDHNKEKIFNPFEQEDHSSKKKFPGTGLGLTLSREISRKLGGDLRLIDSQRGVGSSFEFFIEVDVPVDTHFSERFEYTPLVDKKFDLKNLSAQKILLVDDSKENLLYLSHFLRSAGANVTLADSGHAALDKSSQDDFDIILMDIQMPEMDGYEATSILRSRGFNKPILALTAHALQEEVQKSLKAGCDSHISKPVSKENLLKVINSYLDA